MKLYFGNAVTAATTLMLLALLGFVGYSSYDRDNIQYWGRRSALLLTFDHQVIDGLECGRIFKDLEYYILHPEMILA